MYVAERKSLPFFARFVVHALSAWSIAAIPAGPPAGASPGPLSAGWSGPAGCTTGGRTGAGRRAFATYDPPTIAIEAATRRMGRMRWSLGRGSRGAATAVIVVSSGPQM